MVRLECPYCEEIFNETEVNILDDLDFRSEINEIADLLALGHADEAYRMLDRHFGLGPIEGRRRIASGYGRPVHLIEREARQ